MKLLSRSRSERGIDPRVSILSGHKGDERFPRFLVAGCASIAMVSVCISLEDESCAHTHNGGRKLFQIGFTYSNIFICMGASTLMERTKEKGEGGFGLILIAHCLAESSLVYKQPLLYIHCFCGLLSYVFLLNNSKYSACSPHGVSTTLR